MTKLLVNGIVLVLMLASLPLASIGTTSELLWLSALALLIFGVASLTSPVLRFLPFGDESEDTSESNSNSESDDSAKGGRP